jgi:hypothetical protein
LGDRVEAPCETPDQGQRIVPSSVDTAPAPTWTVQRLVEPLEIELFVTVAVQPLATPATACWVLPDEKLKL